MFLLAIVLILYLHTVIIRNWRVWNNWETTHSFRPIQGNLDSRIREIFANGIRNSGKLCFWNLESEKFVESGIKGFAVRNTAQGIQNHTNDWNPEFKFHWQWLRESSSWNPESTAWNPESAKTVLDSITWNYSLLNIFMMVTDVSSTASRRKWMVPQCCFCFPIVLFHLLSKLNR